MIVACGEALIDMVPVPDDPATFHARAGGCPFNTAVAAARLGARVAFLGRIGTDFLGDRLVDAMEKNAIDRRFVVRSSQPTTLAFVEHGPKGERYAFYSIGAADRSLAVSDLPYDLGADTSFLMTGSISLLQEPTASSLVTLVQREASRISISFDPNIRPSVVTDREGYLRTFHQVAAAAAVLKTSNTDLEWLFPGVDEEAAMDRLLESGPSLVVVTRGADGAVARTRAVKAAAPARRVSVIDTVGAGDTFHGALLYWLEAQGRCGRPDIAAMTAPDLERAISFAAAAAAINCARPGADPPTLPEVRGFLGG